MDVEQLGVPGGRRSDPDRHEGPRTAVVLAAAGLLGLLAVGGVFWLVTAGLGGSTGSGGSAAAPAAVSTSDTTTTPDEGPTTITSSRTSSTTTSTTPRPTLDLPPPEQPTYTLPPTATATTTGGAPATTAPRPPATTTAGGGGGGSATVTNARLSCTGNRKAVKAVLTFTTTGPVQAYVVGGGKVTSGVRGPGDVTMTANGNDTGYCLATVGGQTLGPVPAR